jgi:hypothetical protein
MAPKNMFRLVGDDEIVLIFRYLATLHGTIPRGGTGWRENVASTVRSCTALRITCRHLHGVLKRVDADLAEEIEARRTLDVLPLWAGEGDADDTPYKQQRQMMQREYELIKILRKCETNLCFHCAGKHCGQARREVARKSADGCCQVRGIADARVYNLSACANGKLAYVAMRTYDAVTREAKDTIRLYDNLGDCNPATHEYALKNIDGFELVINLMSAHPAGTCCAFTAEFHPVPEAGDDGANSLFLLSMGSGASGYGHPTATRLSATGAKHFDGVTDMPGVCHAQAMWWVDGYEHRLAVAWSTTLVAGSGHDMFGGSPVTPDERFVIGTYFYNSETNVATPDSFCGPFYGRLLTCNATADGSRVACHVRRRPMHRWDMHYIAMTVDIDRAQANEAKHPSIWKCKGKRRHGKDGFDWGPSAVGISPAGDALVCVHRTPGGIVMEVLDHDEGVNYTTTNSRDITEFFTIFDVPQPLSEMDELFMSESSGYESEEDYANKVKLPFDVDFTSSGSHVVLVDRRPQFGSRAARYSTVLVDISKRRQTKRMKALPLFQERGSAAKALHFETWDQLWVQARRGAVCVSLGGY